MKLNFLQRKLLPFMLMPVLSLAGGCNNKIDLGKVQEFGAVAKQYESQYEDIVKDIYLSCLRDAQYRIGDDTRLERIKAEQSCLEFGYLQQRLLEYHQFLARYTAAVRTLSSDELIQELDGAGKLATAIVTLPIPIPGFKEAGDILDPIVSRIAIAIQQAIANQYRTEVLEESIKEINKEVQIFIVTLAKITDKIYSDNLFQEANAIEVYYAPSRQVMGLPANCSGINDKDSSSSIEEDWTLNCIRLNTQLTSLLVDKQWKEEHESAQINQKLSKVHSYVVTMKEMANLHQELYDSLR